MNSHPTLLLFLGFSMLCNAQVMFGMKIPGKPIKNPEKPFYSVTVDAVQINTSPEALKPIPPNDFHANITIPLGYGDQSFDGGTLFLRFDQVDASLFTVGTLHFANNSYNEVNLIPAQTTNSYLQNYPGLEGLELVLGKVTVISSLTSGEEGFALEFRNREDPADPYPDPGTTPDYRWEIVNPDGAGIYNGGLELRIYRNDSGSLVLDSDIILRRIDEADEIGWEQNVLSSPEGSFTLRQTFSQEISLRDGISNDLVVNDVYATGGEERTTKTVYTVDPHFGRSKLYEIAEDGSWTVYRQRPGANSSITINPSEPPENLPTVQTLFVSRDNGVSALRIGFGLEQTEWIAPWNMSETEIAGAIEDLNTDWLGKLIVTEVLTGPDTYSWEIIFDTSLGLVEGLWVVDDSTNGDLDSISGWKDLPLQSAIDTRNNPVELVQGRVVLEVFDNSGYGTTETWINGWLVEQGAYMEENRDDDPELESVDKTFYTASGFLETIYDSDTTTYPDGRKVTRITDEGTFSLDSDPSAKDFVSDSGVSKRYTTITGSTASPYGLTDNAANGPTYTTWSVRITDGEDRTVLEETWLWDGAATSWDDNLPAGHKISGRYSLYDADGNLDTITDHNGRTIRDETWVDGQRTQVVDERGIVTDYLSYHEDGSVHEQSRAGITTTYTYDDYGNLDTVTRSDTTYSLTTDYDFNARGDLLSITDESGLTTTYSYSAPQGYTRVGSGRIEVVTQANGATEIHDYYLDGQLAAVSGTAVEDVTYDYVILDGSADPDLLPHSHNAGWKKTVETYSNGKVVITVTDMMDRVQEVVEPSPTGSGNVHALSHYDATTGLLTKMEKRDDAGNLVAPVTHHIYNTIGEQIGSGIDVDGGGLAEASTDRLQKFFRYYQKLNGNWWEVSEQITYQTDGSATPTSQIYRNQLTDLAADQLSVTEQVNAMGAVTTTTTTISGNVVTETTNLPETTNHVERVMTDGRLTSQTTESGEQTVYTYVGPLKQMDSVAVNSGGQSRVTNYTYYLPTETGTGQLPGRLKSTSNPHNAVTSYTYYTNGETGAGNVKTKTQPAAGDGSAAPEITYAYNAQGTVISESGTGTYDKAFTYYETGQLQTLTTVRTGDLVSNGDTTKWEYLPSGELAKKTYADGTSVGYAYDGAGRLTSRTWARGVVTRYGYDPVTGDLLSITYSDNTQPVTFASYTRSGQPGQITDAAGTRTLSYDAAGNVDDETYSAGLLAGVFLDPNYDSHSRKVRHEAKLDGQLLATHVFDWADATGLLGFVSDGGAHKGTYSYVSNGAQLANVQMKQNEQAVLQRDYDYTLYDAAFTATANPDLLYRIGKITNTVTATSTVVSSHTYHYDDLDRRQGALLADGSFWDYGYDLKSQLTMANRYDSQGVPVPDQQFGWGYDEIGNFDSHNANELNQYNPAEKTVRGESHEDAVVFVEADIDGAPFEERASEWHWGDGRQLWWQDLPIDNSTGAKTVPVTVMALMKDPDDPTGNTVLKEEESGTLEVPAAGQAAEYDLDGNTTLLHNEWIYRWNGENRLKEAETVTPQYRLAFAYDYQGRRVRKQVWEYDTQTGAYPAQPTEDLLFLYDDWNLVAEIDNTVSPRRPIRTHLWGQDISGTLQGAGGVGGLIATTHHTYDPTPATSTYFVAYDGNGNVMALVDAADGSVAAEYDYDPWGGGKILSNGELYNGFQFSSKYYDSSSNLYYFGQRYMAETTKQWLSDDPIEELGGTNVRSYVYNAPTNFIDILGREPMSTTSGEAGLDEDNGSGPARDFVFKKVSDGTIVTLKAVQTWQEIAENGRLEGAAALTAAKAAFEGKKRKINYEPLSKDFKRTAGGLNSPGDSVFFKSQLTSGSLEGALELYAYYKWYTGPEGEGPKFKALADSITIFNRTPSEGLCVGVCGAATNYIMAIPGTFNSAIATFFYYECCEACRRPW